jgi:endonuclease YncB( thermonuclease family)
LLSSRDPRKPPSCSVESSALPTGDTITVLDANKTPHRICIAGIDAPERGQPGGQRSKESLSGKSLSARLRPAGAHRMAET